FECRKSTNEEDIYTYKVSHQRKRKYTDLKRRRVLAQIAKSYKAIMLSSSQMQDTLSKVSCDNLCIRNANIEECKDICFKLWSKKSIERHNHMLQQFLCFQR